MITEVKGNRIASIPVYLMQDNISFHYDGNEHKLIVALAIDQVIAKFQSYGFDINDFNYN